MEYKIIGLDSMDGFKNFSNDEEICKFLKEVCNELGYKTEEMAGGALEHKFSDSKSITITDNTNPLAILRILKCLGFKTYKIKEIKYIQSSEQWDKFYDNDNIDKNDDSKIKRQSLLEFLDGCVEFINRNLGLLNDFSGLLEQKDNDSNSMIISQELLEIKNELQNEICGKLKKIIDDSDKIKLDDNSINELGNGAKAIIDFLRMMRNSTTRQSSIASQSGGFYNSNIFNNKCGDRFSNLLNKLSGAIEEKYIIELKKNIKDLSKNTKSLNKKINQIAGNKNCEDIDFKNLSDKIQKHVDKTTAMSFAFFELLKTSKKNGIDVENVGESIEMIND